ncbi:MAG: polymer-forming cytoskeletal protein [Thermoanaerobaculia bacterium]
MLGKKPEPIDTEHPLRRFTDETERLETVIGDETHLKGNLETAASVEVRGTIEGDCAIGGILWVRQGGGVTGAITVEAAVLEGEVRGNIQAKERVELRPGSSLRGNIDAGSLAIAEGAFYQGKVKMTNPETPGPITFQEKRKPAPEDE